MSRSFPFRRRFLLSAVLLAAGWGFAGPIAHAAGPRAAEPRVDCVLGCPVMANPTGGKVVHRVTHSLGNNPTTKFADWVAYVVEPGGMDGTRDRKWRRDDALSESDTLAPRDYKGANAAHGYDRGHQAPLASLTGHEGWEKTNFLSNITPQINNLNQGAWKRLEDAVRDAVRAETTSRAIVFTGPLYEREMPALPQSTKSHTVPSGYWKLIVLELRDGFSATGFVMDQATPRKAERCAAERHSTLAAIEARAGLALLPTVPAEDREAMIARGYLARLALGCTVSLELAKAGPD